MTGGYITGGWGFVIAAYALTASALLLYGVSLWMRLKGEKR